MTQPRSQDRSRRDVPRAVGDLVAGALRDLGMPSARLSRRVEEAWRAACEPAWRGETRPLRLEGGVLVVGVRSAALRQELAQYHRERLLSVLRAALPDVPLVALRIGPDPAAGTVGRDVSDEARR